MSGRRPAGVLVAVAIVAAACSSPGSRRTSPPLASGADGTLMGRLVAVGGPAPGSARPLEGSVTVRGGETHHLTVGGDGTYTVTLPPGAYTVTGKSPEYEGGKGVCRAIGGSVKLMVGTTTADVVCSEK